MRILALLAATWGLVAMPALCRAGVLAQCCTPPHKAAEETDGCPDGCPGCGGDAADEPIDETGCPEDRDCSDCADVCNAVSLAQQKMTGADLETAVAPAVSGELDAGAGRASSSCATPDACRRPHHENMPYPPSDQPLLI